MGMKFFAVSGCTASTTAPAARPVGNPDPRRFTINHHEKHGRFLIVEVVYGDCLNYEGKKVLVYEGVSWNRVSNAVVLDPHFCDDPAHLSPVARFAPTIKGWNFARAFCQAVP